MLCKFRNFLCGRTIAQLQHLEILPSPSQDAIYHTHCLDLLDLHGLVLEPAIHYVPPCQACNVRQRGLNWCMSSKTNPTCVNMNVTYHYTLILELVLSWSGACLEARYFRLNAFYLSIKTTITPLVWPNVGLTNISALDFKLYQMECFKHGKLPTSCIRLFSLLHVVQ